MSVHLHLAVGRDDEVALHAGPQLILLGDLDLHVVDALNIDVIYVADIAPDIVVVHGIFIVRVIAGLPEMDDIGHVAVHLFLLAVLIYPAV